MSDEPTEAIGASIEMTDVESATTKSKATKRKHRAEGATSAEKRPALTDMVFYDGSHHPAGVLHELRPELRSEFYQFETEATSANPTRFRCTLIVDKDLPEPVTAIGVGRSKQFAKNMAAQQALMALYRTYRPPPDAILTEDCDSLQRNRFVPTLPPSLDNDPSILIDSIRKHLTVKSLAIKSPLQLFHELFVHNQRLNTSTSTKNRVELIENEDNLIVVRVTAMDQYFWGVSTAKHIAFNEACQQAIETICRVSFREAKTQFIRALQEMNKLKLPDATADTNNNDVLEQSEHSEEPTTELPSLVGVSSNFLIPNDES